MPCHLVFWLFYHSINVLNAFIYSHQQRLYLWVDFINKSRTVYDFERFGFSQKRKTRIVLINMMMDHSRGFSIICTSLFENINNYINFCLNDSIYSQWILWFILFSMEPLTFMVGPFIFEFGDTYVDSIESIHQMNFEWAVLIVDDRWL